MKKSCFVFFCFALLLVFFIFGCGDGNPYVQELLRGPSTLENLSVMIDDGQVYSSRPDFHPDTLDYTIKVPYPTQSLRILTTPYKNGKAQFTMNNITNTEGTFLFLEEEQATISIYVERPHMDPRTYTLRIIRGSDVLLWDINFWETLPVGDGIDIQINTMNPGYDSDSYRNYKLPVQANADHLTIEAVLRPNAAVAFYKATTEGAIYDSHLGPYTDVADQNNVFSLAGFTPEGLSKQIFTVDMEAEPNIVFYIKVWMKNAGVDEPSTAELYKITIVWPNRVSYYDSLVKTVPIDTTLFSPLSISIKGTAIGGFYHFNAGQPVSFTLEPPFGTRTKTVEIQRGANPWSTLYNRSNDEIHTDLYSFIMPQDMDVQIWAVWEKILPASNVRYARPGGTNASAESINWYSAGDLNKLIDEYNIVTNNYEIWLSNGTYYPPGSNDFNRSFILEDGIKIYGGFRGVESSREQREYTDSGKTRPKYPSILSGNYPNGDKIFHTLIAAGISTAYLDGLEIEGSRNGNWSSSTPSVKSIPVNNNYGGVFYVVNSSPVLKNVTIRNGLSQYAAGMYVTTTGAETSRPILLHCRFTNNQSSSAGSSLTVRSGAGTSHILMIGGTMEINLDAMGVVNIGNDQTATFVNVSIINNREAAIHSMDSALETAIGTGTGNFINCTITGNRGEGGTGTSSSLPNVVSIGTYQNSIIANNAPQQMPAELSITNTYAPGHADSISSSSLPGNISLYPITSGGVWNTASPIYNNFVDPGTPPFGTSHPYATLNLGNIIIDSLMLDGNGNTRFSGSSIKLGAIQ